MRLQSGEFRRDASIFFGLACNVFGGLFADRMNDLIGLLCLTEKPDNLLMWAHYADSHAGFVVSALTSRRSAIAARE